MRGEGGRLDVDIDSCGIVGPLEVPWFPVVPGVRWFSGGGTGRDGELWFEFEVDISEEVMEGSLD